MTDITGTTQLLRWEITKTAFESVDGLYNRCFVDTQSKGEQYKHTVTELTPQQCSAEYLLSLYGSPAFPPSSTGLYQQRQLSCQCHGELCSTVCKFRGLCLYSPDIIVPGSNPRMLEKSLSSPADSVAYDLEDSVSPGKKADARRLVAELLDVSIGISLLP